MLINSFLVNLGTYKGTTLSVTTPTEQGEENLDCSSCSGLQVMTVSWQYMQPNCHKKNQAQKVPTSIIRDSDLHPGYNDQMSFQIHI